MKPHDYAYAYGANKVYTMLYDEYTHHAHFMHRKAATRFVDYLTAHRMTVVSTIGLDEPSTVPETAYLVSYR